MIDISPYSPPKHSLLPEVRRLPGWTPSWPYWIIGCVVFEAIMVTVVMALRGAGMLQVDGGFVCIVISGTIVFLACVMAGSRYDRIPAFLIGQFFNVAVWLTVVTTMVVMIPVLLPGREVNERHLQNFLMVGLWGAAAAAIVVSLAGMFRKSKPKTDE